MGSKNRRTEGELITAQPVAGRAARPPASFAGSFAPIRVRIICAGLVFILVLGAYLLTLAPTVTLVDSGELIVAARFLGVAHPPGFPLYVMLAHLATLLPFGNVAERVNFASALFAALASGLTCLTVAEVFITPNTIAPARKGPNKSAAARTTKRKGDALQKSIPTGTPLDQAASTSSRIGGYAVEVVPAISAGLFLGFSRTLWGYGTIAEVYTLNTMLVVSIYFLMMRWRRRVIEARAISTAGLGSRSTKNANRWRITREDIPLYAAALTFGLALGVHHVTVGLNILALAGFVLLTEGWTFFVSPRLLYSFLISVSGLSVYAYLPIAASRNPVLDWGNPTTFNRLWLHITGWQYQVFLKAGDVGSLAKQFVVIVGREFGPPWLPVVLILSVVGFIALFRERNNALLVFLALVLLADLGYGLSYDIAEDKDAYYLPVYIVISIAAGLGIRFLLKLFSSNVGLRDAALLSIAAVVLLPAVTLASNYHYNNRSRYYIAHDYVDNIFSTVAPNGMVLTMDWQVYSPMMYVREVERRRDDVIAVDVNLLRRSWYYAYLEKEYPKLIGDTRDKVDQFLEDLRAWEQNPDLYQRDAALNKRISDRFNQMILAFISDHIKMAPVYLTEDIALDFGGENPGLASSLNKTYQLVPQGLVFQVEGDRDFHEPADFRMSMRGLFDGSIAFDPDDVVEQKVIPTYLNMLVNRGRYLAAYGYQQKAIECCREAMKLKPDFGPAKVLLGECMSAIENRAMPASGPPERAPH